MICGNRRVPILLKINLRGEIETLKQILQCFVPQTSRKILFTSNKQNSKRFNCYFGLRTSRDVGVHLFERCVAFGILYCIQVLLYVFSTFCWCKITHTNSLLTIGCGCLVNDERIFVCLKSFELLLFFSLRISRIFYFLTFIFFI